MAGLNDTGAVLYYNAFTGKATWTAVDPYVRPLEGTVGSFSDSNTTGMTETTEFARQQLTGTWAYGTGASLGTATYNSAIAFGATSGATGTMSALGFFNHVSNVLSMTTLLGFTALATAKSAASGETVSIASGILQLAFGSGKTAGVHFSGYSMDKAVKAFTGDTTWTAANRWCVPVITAPSDDAGTGIAFPAGTWANGARQEMLNASWAASTDGSGAYNANLDWGAYTGAGETIVGYAIYDASTAGNYMGFRGLTGAKPMTNGDTFVIASGSIIIDCATIA